MCGSNLVLWVIDLILCRNHTVFIIIVLWHNLKSGMVIPPAVGLLCSIALSLSGSLYFQNNFWIVFFPYFCEIESLVGIALNHRLLLVG